ncbi:hypothetical protein RND81_12G220900 [Saponaria officinalis]|uniref:Uncharacterized protein n=1 Tax=Saponaria officinalis TaxID=3572 RepID=A0AAW1HDW9_SAPOF
MTRQSAMCFDYGGWDDVPCNYDQNQTHMTVLIHDYDKPEVCDMYPRPRLSLRPKPRPDDVLVFDDDDDDDDCVVDEFIAQYSVPPYFKLDHPDDDLFLKKLGDAQVPWRTQLKYPTHADQPLVKDVVALIIWQDTKHDDTWERLRKMSPPDHVDSLYSHAIRAAASLVYSYHTRANLFKIGHQRTLYKQMDKIFTQLQIWAKKGTPIDEACKLLVQLTANNDEFSFVTENYLADMLCYYAFDCPYNKFERPLTPKVNIPPNVKDQLFDDITEVVRKLELSPTELKADEYTHWMMTLLKESVTAVEISLINRAIGANPMVKLGRPSDTLFVEDAFPLLLNMLVKTKDRMRQELFDVVQPLYKVCELHRYKVCTEISETVQVADLRRMSLGSRFIGRSHLIWAFYKLGYALPLEIRNTINVFDSDEDHPPYHIYMAALKLALCSGETMMQLDHFVFAVLHSKEIDSNGERTIEFYQHFKDFQTALESMETEIEPKSTVTVRPCGSLDVFADLNDDSDDGQERTADFEPDSSDN